MAEGYRIDPQGVEEVLSVVQQASQDLSAAIGGIGGAQDDVATGSSTCTAVPAALSAFLDAQSDAVTDVMTRITACVFGAATATTDYVQADDTMASDVAQAQSAAVDAASAGDFRWFTSRAGGR